MKFRARLYFLTLVLFPALVVAAPPPKQSDNLGEGPSAPHSQAPSDPGLMIAPATRGEPQPPLATRYFPYRQSLSPRMGATYSSSGDPTWSPLLGVNYLWPRLFSPQAEFGADVVSGIGGLLNFSVRHVLRERQYFRPFLRWGLTHMVVAEDRLATLTNKDNYYVRVGAGLEQVVVLPVSLRLELEVMIGLRQQLALLTLGPSWAW